MSITARDAAARLPALLAEAQGYADEIVVGVDRASADATWDVACAGADRVFAFTHRGVTSPARMAGLERAAGDWVLFLDDDEGMDAAFPALRDELLGAAGVTHWWLPRRWLDATEPAPTHLAADPWWPDWSLRLARADPTRVFKPTQLHSGLRVVGRAGHEARTALLHYERLARSPAERAAKLARYRERGQAGAVDAFYGSADAVPRAPVVPAPLRVAGAVPARRRRLVVDPEPDDLEARPAHPGWGAVLTVAQPGTGAPGATLTATVTATNTGTLRWDCADRDAWPALGLAYRVHAADGTPLPDAAPRTPIGRDVAPGEAVALLATLRAPDAPGTYELRWQLVSEHEHWFDDLGSPAARCALLVRP